MDEGGINSVLEMACRPRDIGSHLQALGRRPRPGGAFVQQDDGTPRPTLGVLEHIA